MARLSNVFNNKEELKKEDHPRRIIKWIHYSKLKENAEQYCPARDREEIEALADLIEAAGEVLENLSVSKLDTDEYKIIAGHKRCQACKMLVEERNLKQFAFLPCIVNNVSAVQESFRVMASNGYHSKKAYELMHEITEMERLLREHPEEFPKSLQTGRMVERLSKKMGIARATIQEYQLISKNLTPDAMEKFRNGEIEKSAAVALARMPEMTQKEVIEKGITKNVDIEKYREEKLEPDSIGVKVSFRLLGIDDYDKSTVSRKALAHFLRTKFGRTSYSTSQGEINISCTNKGITISGKTVSWERYIKLLDMYCPRTDEKESGEEAIQKENEPKKHLKKEKETTPSEEQKPVFIPMDELIDKDGGEKAPEEDINNYREKAHVLKFSTIKQETSRQEWINTLSMHDLAHYLNRYLSVNILKSPELLYHWLSDSVDDYGNSLEVEKIGKQVR